MKPKKFTILILVAIIITLSLTIAARENQHSKTLVNMTEEYTKKTDERQKIMDEFIEGYNELYASYNELYMDYQRLYDNLSIEGWQEFIVTGYSTNDCSQGTKNIVATNFNLDWENVKNIPIIAVDPGVIPLYSIVEIENMGAYLALDTGELIKGNRIDILFDTKEEAIEFGKQELLVRVIR